MSDKNTLMAGVPMVVSGIRVRQPTLNEIFKGIGYDSYSAYMYVLGMTVEQFVEANQLKEFFDKLSPADKETIHIFDLLSGDTPWRVLFAKALSFFILGEVSISDEQIVVIDSDRTVVLTATIYEQVRDSILLAACLKNEEETAPKGFVNDAAKRAYERLMELKKTHKKTDKPVKANPSMAMWNVIGAVSAHSSSYNLISIWDLTVWQLYDQFYRISKQEYLSGYAAKWAVWGSEKFDFDSWYKIETKK